jgi:hypothetical protein
MKSLTTISLILVISISITSCNRLTKNDLDIDNINNIHSSTESKNFILFSKNLEFKDYKFDVSTTGEGSIQQLTIQPYGLKEDNIKIEMEIDGSVTNAEIEDLDADGYPELLVYTKSAGSGSYGNVIGYSVNAEKSMSKITFPSVAENQKTNKGYMGHDEFNIIELTLVQKYKIYNDEDTNSNPTGKTRQIQYKLQKNNDFKKFVINNVVEY